MKTASRTGKESLVRTDGIPHLYLLDPHLSTVFITSIIVCEHFVLWATDQRTWNWRTLQVTQSQHRQSWRSGPYGNLGGHHHLLHLDFLFFQKHQHFQVDCTICASVDQKVQTWLGWCVWMLHLHQVHCSYQDAPSDTSSCRLSSIHCHYSLFTRPASGNSPCSGGPPLQFLPLQV